MPWRFYDRYFFVAGVLIFIALLSFIASYYEVALLFTVNNINCGLTVIGLIMLCVENEYTSTLISQKLEHKCSFVIPTFSQDTLLNYGCPTKYLSFESDVNQLACPKAEQTRVWEDNVDLLIDD